MNRNQCAFAIFMALVAGADGAGAQVASAAETVSEESGLTGYQDIVVTAQKRTQSLDKLGMTVAVLSSEAFQERRLDQVEDIANVVPGLSFTKSNTTVPVFTLRGIGFYDNGINAYPTVTVYMDEAPLPFSAMAQNLSFDLERLEVLKGPQGTLFGSNATGGALNFIAAKPTDDFAAGVTLGYARFNEKRVEGFINGPISDTLNGRLAFQWVNADDWQYDHVTGNTTGKANIAAARLSLDWAPTDTVRALLTVNGWKDRSDPQAAQFFFYQPQQVPTPPNPVEGYPLTPHKPRAAGFSTNLTPVDDDLGITTEPYGDNSLFHTSLRLDVDVTPDMTLTSLTSYAKYKMDMAVDRDGVALANFDLPNVDGEIETISQEVRLANAASNSFRWIIGGNYSRDDVSERYTMHWPDSSTRIAFDPPFLGRSGYYTIQDMENWAVFANAEMDLGDFTLKGGARYTENKRFGRGCNFDVAGYGIAEFFTGLSQITRQVLGLPPSPDSQVQPGACSLIDTVGVNGNPPTGLPIEDQRSINEDNISWRAGVDWRATDGVLFYFNVAKGYKSGSIPGAPSTFNEQIVAVTQESVLAFEGGAKTRFLDNKASLNLAGFYYDYKDKQLRTRYVNPVFGLLDRLQNIPKSRIWGIEAEATVRPADGVSLYANYLYLNDRIKNFQGIDPTTGAEVDFSGAEMPFAPNHQFSVGGQVETPVTDSITGFVGVDYNYRSATTSIVGGGQIYKIGSYGLLDLRAGVRGEDDRWSVFLWGKNVTNEYYWNNVTQVFDTITRYAGRPATYGITASFKFD